MGAAGRRAVASGEKIMCTSPGTNDSSSVHRALSTASRIICPDHIVVERVTHVGIIIITAASVPSIIDYAFFRRNTLGSWKYIICAEQRRAAHQVLVDAFN